MTAARGSKPRFEDEDLVLPNLESYPHIPLERPHPRVWERIKRSVEKLLGDDTN